MLELIICRGIPASGKSTYAYAWVQATPGRVRVNRDDIRFQMYGVYHGGNVNEDAVTIVEDSMVTAALSAGQSVIVDDTNIRHAYVKRFAALGYAQGAKVTVREFAISIDEAIYRNAARDRKVPDDVIKDMHQRFKSSGKVDISQSEPGRKYVAPPDGAAAIIVDIDGTIAHNGGHRSFYDWLKVGGDDPIPEVIEIVNLYSLAGYEILVMSGRDSAARLETIKWLDKHGVRWDDLIMRAAGDQRKDSIVKLELFDAMVRDEYDVSFVLDDRNQVVDMWRSIGLRCLQVAPGDF